MRSHPSLRPSVFGTLLTLHPAFSRFPLLARSSLLLLFGLLLGSPPGAAAQSASYVALAGFRSPAVRAPSAPARAAALRVPVRGVAPDELRDSYHEGRSEGREHRAIDIHAPRGTPVLAVADGKILKLHSGDRGGLSVYQLDMDGQTRYYYAHLDEYAEGVGEGLPVRKGDVIGYVGDTGNAAPGDYHLHFSVAILSDPARWWEGENLNPYTLLTGAAREP